MTTTATRGSTSRTAPRRPGRTTHLTVRGRLVVLLTLVALLLAAFSVGRAASGAATSPAAVPPPPAAVPMTVQPGDTLWEVARRVAPQADPREVVQVLQRANDLQGPALRVGQQLLLPVVPAGA